MTEGKTPYSDDQILILTEKGVEIMEDNWKDRSTKMKCEKCMLFVEKKRKEATNIGDQLAIGRCRRNAPRLEGWPVVFSNDWCGEFKLDENK